MPSILSRFRLSPSATSSHSSEERRQRRASTASSSAFRSSDHETAVSPATKSTTLSPGRSGSSFVEEFGEQATSPSKRKAGTAVDLTPTGRKHKPSPLEVPVTDAKPPGTPKLVLTEEGSNSPRSFTSSPVGARNGRGNDPPVGLGIGSGSGPLASGTSSSGTEEDLETPTYNPGMDGTMGPSNGVHLSHSADSQFRSDSTVSHSDARHSRSGSIVSRLAASNILLPVDWRQSNASKSGKKDKKSKKKRTKSISSVISGQSGSIAGVLAKSGLHIASPTDSEVQSTFAGKRNSSVGGNKRSPFLVRGVHGGDDESLRTEGDENAIKLDGEDDYDDDDDDETDTDLDEHLPVTGFAVASNRRQGEFHALFRSVDEGDYLIEDYGCALSKDILVQGRMYVSENHLCFHANIFGWVTDVVILFTDIRTIEKKMTALVIPNAITVTTHDNKYTWASFISRDTTYDVMMNIWRLCNPNAVMSTISFGILNGSRPASIAADETGTEIGDAKGGGKGHVKTECTCGKEGRHYSETALNTTFPSTPEKVYSLMFNSGWYKTFLTDSQKLTDIQLSDWRPNDEKHLMRSLSYIKPLNGAIGPKQTKCHITDEQEHCDYNTYISMMTTTKTPDVPSGGVFSVKTRSCLTWAGANSTKVIVTTTVEWTGKSWVKGIIEKSAIDGQKAYHDDLEKGMRAYIKEHATEFAGEGGVEDQEADEAELEKKEAKPTEAEAYAAQQRRKREERGYWSVQGGVDNVVSGVKSIVSGLRSILEAIGDVLSDLPMSKEVVLGLVIGLLVFSNVYTFFAYRSNEGVETRRAKRLGTKAGLGDDQVVEAMKAILRDGGRRGVVDETKDLESILDSVEERVGRLRVSIKSAVKEGRHGKAEDLD